MSAVGPTALEKKLERIYTEITTTRDRLDTLTAERDRVILALVKLGHSYAAITKRCGLSRGRIAQIVAAHPTG